MLMSRIIPHMRSCTSLTRVEALPILVSRHLRFIKYGGDEMKDWMALNIVVQRFEGLSLESQLPLVLAAGFANGPGARIGKTYRDTAL